MLTDMKMRGYEKLFISIFHLFFELLFRSLINRDHVNLIQVLEMYEKYDKNVIFLAKCHKGFTKMSQNVASNYKWYFFQPLDTWCQLQTFQAFWQLFSQDVLSRLDKLLKLTGTARITNFLLKHQHQYLSLSNNLLFRRCHMYHMFIYLFLCHLSKKPFCVNRNNRGAQ